MTDPRYPSYKDFDSLIDVEWLRSLDGFLRNRIVNRLDSSRDVSFYTGPFRQDPGSTSVPGPQMIYLSRPRGPDNYYKLDQPDYWEPGDDTGEFEPLMAFIGTLPFAATARMLIIYDEIGRAVPAHRDHDSVELCHEFVWFRTNLDKPFYMLDSGSDQKLYVSSHAAWFDTVNQFHGADANGQLSVSIRVDGIFSESLRARIPFRTPNRASTPSHWAASPEQ